MSYERYETDDQDHIPDQKVVRLRNPGNDFIIFGTESGISTENLDKYNNYNVYRGIKLEIGWVNFNDTPGTLVHCNSIGKL